MGYGPKKTAILTVVCALISLFAAAPAQGQSCASGAVFSIMPRWLTITAPEFPSADRTNPLYPGHAISDFAVVPSLAGRLYVTNGIRVLRSDDDGCTWKDVFELPTAPTSERPFSKERNFISSVVAPEHPAASDVVYLVVEDKREQGFAFSNWPPKISVVLSPDAGKTWRVSNGGLPPIAQDAAVLTAPSDPDTAYVKLWSGAWVLYVTKDGGASWQPVHPGQPPAPDPSKPVGEWGLFNPVPGNVPFQSGPMRVDPLDAKQLWGFVNQIVYHSTDGGATWARSDVASDSNAMTGAVPAVFRAPGKSTQVVVGSAANYRPSLYRSDDAGKSWSKLPAFPNCSTQRTGQDFAYGTGALVGVSADRLLAFPHDTGLDCAQENVYRFDRRGRRWVRIPAPPTYFGPGAITATNAVYVLAGARPGAGQEVYMTIEKYTGKL